MALAAAKAFSAAAAADAGAKTPVATTASGETLEALLKLSKDTLKAKCVAANTPVTGSKSKLAERLLNPSQHQRKKARPGEGKKLKRVKKAVPKKRAGGGFGGFVPGYGGRSYGGFGGFGYGFSDDDGSDDDGYGYERCESCGFDLDPHCDICPECEPSFFGGANGICPGCLKRSPPCEMDEDGTYVCEM